MIRVPFGKRRALTSIVFLVADYKLALYDDGGWRVPALDARDNEIPSETALRAASERLGVQIRFVDIGFNPRMRADARPAPLPFSIDTMDADVRHVQFYYMGTTKDSRAHALRDGARWFTKDEIAGLDMHETYREMCQHAFEIYLNLDL